MLKRFASLISFKVLKGTGSYWVEIGCKGTNYFALWIGSVILCADSDELERRIRGI